MFALVCVLFSLTAQAQRLKQKDADKLFKNEQYQEALPLYEAKSDKEPEDFYKLGLCYFHADSGRTGGIPHLEKYLSYTDTINTAYYYLAKLYHLDGQFEAALGYYDKFLSTIEEDPTLKDEKLKDLIKGDVAQESRYCNFGKMMMHESSEVIIENLGSSVNSRFRDYAPVISSKEKQLYFTSRRPLNLVSKKAPDGLFFERIYQCDILRGSLFEGGTSSYAAREGFFSVLKNLEFSEPQALPSHINGNTHNATVGLSHDDAKLYFYRDHDVWYTDKNDQAWSDPHKMREVNSKAFEPSVCLSYDGNVMFVVSDKEGGFGGLDLYMRRKQANGTWSELENLGPTINTKLDEDGPYFDPDGQTLYFSSKGHSSMGGYDVFKTRTKGDVLSDNSWSDPINMGYPVNTPADEVYFSMTSRYNRAYYSSSRPGGFGQLDLYRLTFANERIPLAELKGYVWKGKEKVPMKSEITLYDTDGTQISSHKSDDVTGEFLLLLGHGKTYDMFVQTDGFAPYKRRTHIPEQQDYFQLYQEVHHIYLTDKEGNVIGQQVSVVSSFNDSTLVDRDALKDQLDDISADSLHLLDEISGTTVYSDVKFYISKDSLITLKEEDPELLKTFPEETTVSYFEPEHQADSAFTLGDIQAFISYEDAEEITDEETKEVYTEAEAVNDAKDLEISVENLVKNKQLIKQILLFFDFDDDQLNDSTYAVLQIIYDYMNTEEEVRFNIIGHTDAKGNKAYNKRLSERRADRVRKYLIGKGIHPKRLVIKGQGSAQPLKQSDTTLDDPEIRKWNRRVEFRLIE